LSRIAWFPDGSRALVSGFLKSTRKLAVWVLTPQQNELRLLRSDASQAVPSPDGKEIAFLNPDGSEIWTMKSTGNFARRLVTDSSPGTFQTVLWTPDGRRLKLSVMGGEYLSHAAAAQLLHDYIPRRFFPPWRRGNSNRGLSVQSCQQLHQFPRNFRSTLAGFHKCQSLQGR
jgi:hypothetical protein